MIGAEAPSYFVTAANALLLGPRRDDMTKSITLLAALFTLTTLPGCFIFMDDYEDEENATIIIVEESNAAPEILAGDTWWICDLDGPADAYFSEFQAHVDDLDGLGDVQFVDVTIEDAITGEYLDSFGLIYEGDGIWGGLIWEDESNLFCGEEVDVLVEAWDYEEAYDQMLITY
jgi:hypothetical protein